MAGPSPAERDALARRTVRVLVVAQVFAGAGLAAGITVGALLAEDMLGSTDLAGLPAALFTLGAAAAALLVGRMSQASGRRVGLSTGYAVGALGGGGVVAAAALDSVPLLLVSLFVYGSGLATNLQARYAGADLVEPSRRARAVSAVLVATTFGAVLGPNTVELTGSLADTLGIRELAGPFLLATVAYAAAALVVSLRLRPDPLVTARAWALVDGPSAEDRARTGDEEETARRLLRLGALAMIITQAVMIAVMTMTPIHMRDHGHGLSATGVVIAVHVAAMYLPSPVTGRLADRFGRRPIILAGGVSLALAGLVAAVAPTGSVALLSLALALLGLGWNLGLVGGTALVTDATPLAIRARVQGSVDLGVALAGAAGGLGSGFVVAGTSYAGLALLGTVLALAVVPLLLFLDEGRAPVDVPAHA